MGHCDKGLDGVDVFLLHLGDARAGREQREAGQGLYVCISLQLEQSKTKPFLKSYKKMYYYHKNYYSYSSYCLPIIFGIFPLLILRDLLVLEILAKQYLNISFVKV